MKKIVYCHNYYRYRGGEDISFEIDLKMLRNKGHTVIPFTRDNRDVEQDRPLAVASETLWNFRSRSELYRILKNERPDILHCNNLFPQISASAYSAAKRLNIPVVQALRNYRAFCANSAFFRQGTVCTKCAKLSAAWYAVPYRCYRQSRSASAVVVGMQLLHRLLRVRSRYVDAYVTPTMFSREKHIEGGFDPERIFVRNNFLMPDLGFVPRAGEFALFAGRLSEEKGLGTVLDTWLKNDVRMPLKIIGTGPMEADYRKQAGKSACIEFTGELDHEAVMQLMGRVRCLLMPSLVFETFGRTIAESFSRGTPVIGSRRGAIPELVEDGVSGFLFAPGDADSLMKCLQTLMGQSDAEEGSMRRACRFRFDERFSQDSSYRQLVRVYDYVLAKRRPKQTQRTPLASPSGSECDGLDTQAEATKSIDTRGGS